MDKKELLGFSLSELKALRTEIDGIIAGKQEEEEKALIADFQARAEELGCNLADLVTGSTSTKPKTKVAPKYRNPGDQSMTWTGRGRKPSWVLQLLDEGKSLDDLLI